MLGMIYNPPSPPTEKELTNRLILIGNGFDLAHGHKTSFQDFLLDYLIKILQEFKVKHTYEDELLFLKPRTPNSIPLIPIPNILNPANILEKFSQIRNRYEVTFSIKSVFFSNLFDLVSEQKWVNIEAIYFETLVEEMQNWMPDRWNEGIGELNKQLEFIEKKLIEYLEEIQSHDFIKSPTENFVKKFTEDFLPNDFVTLSLEKPLKPQNLLFLNFNYTNFLSPYFDETQKQINSDTIFIHGKIGEETQNPIIFGFGDEHDKKYLEFEEKNNNILFEHIKSFKYLRTDNYYNLLRFLDSNLFQVHIYGHSCGVTDRTMLNHIFEHENCKSIKIFYHDREDGTNDFVDKTYEISRHFNNKGLMRKKVVPFNLSQPMPQPNQFEKQID